MCVYVCVRVCIGSCVWGISDAPSIYMPQFVLHASLCVCVCASMCGIVLTACTGRVLHASLCACVHACACVYLCVCGIRLTACAVCFARQVVLHVS